MVLYLVLAATEVQAGAQASRNIVSSGAIIPKEPYHYPGDIPTLARILACGYLRYWRSRSPEFPDKPLASPPERSVHVTVVNAEETAENE